MATIEKIIRIESDFYTADELDEFDEPTVVRGRLCKHHSSNHPQQHAVDFCTLHNCRAKPDECWCWKAEEVETARLKFGDFVVYDPGYCEPQLGRVAEDDKLTNYVFVCFGSGCTSAAVHRLKLRMATAEEVAACGTRLGHHRFDEFCPERDDDCCYMCKAKKCEADHGQA